MPPTRHQFLAVVPRLFVSTFFLLLMAVPASAKLQDAFSHLNNSKVTASKLPDLEKGKKSKTKTAEKVNGKNETPVNHQSLAITKPENGAIPPARTSAVPSMLAAFKKPANDDGENDDSSGELPVEEGNAEKEDEEEDDDQDEHWRFFNSPFLKQRGITVDGWMAQSLTLNPDRPADRSNGPLGMNDRSNDYLFNQLGLAFEKPLSDDTSIPSLGWRVDMMYGSDARFVQSAGFDDEWISGNLVSLAMPQLYFDLQLPNANPWGDGISLRVGRFWSPIGYEGVPALDRYFHSATFAFMLAQPSTHTGILASVPIGENWTAQAGIVAGWDVWRDNNNTPAFLGTLGWISDDEATSLTHVFYHGNQTDDLKDRQSTYELIATRQLSERWNYVGWFDFNFAERIATGPNGQTKNAQWYGFIHSLTYVINDNLSTGVRAEWFHDNDGVRIVHPLIDDPLGAGDLFGLTFGSNYTPHKNWLIRPEIRWDGANNLKPFDDLSSSHQFTASMDVVFRF